MRARRMPSEPAYVSTGPPAFLAAPPRGVLLLDARPRDFWTMSHIPGSLSLPEEEFDRAFAELEPKLRATFNIVVYCSGYGCEASHIVARKLREKGIHAAILSEGWPAWTDAGYPVTGPK